MQAVRSIFPFLMMVLCSIAAIGQVEDRYIKPVLAKSKIDSLFVFGEWSEEGQDETHLKYLGKVTTKTGRTFKIVTSIWIWGSGHRTTSRILVFNESNRYVGNYNMAMTYNLPTKLVNGKLVFSNRKNKDCDPKVTAVVNLANGLPRHFARKCNVEWTGETFEFD
jgi:hypothetical protein